MKKRFINISPPLDPNYPPELNIPNPERKYEPISITENDILVKKNFENYIKSELKKKFYYITNTEKNKYILDLFFKIIYDYLDILLKIELITVKTHLEKYPQIQNNIYFCLTNLTDDYKIQIIDKITENSNNENIIFFFNNNPKLWTLNQNTKEFIIKEQNIIIKPYVQEKEQNIIIKPYVQEKELVSVNEPEPEPVVVKEQESLNPNFKKKPWYSYSFNIIPSIIPSFLKKKHP